MLRTNTPAILTVKHWRLFIPKKLAGGLLVIQQPSEAPWMRQWICNNAGRFVIVCLLAWHETAREARILLIT